MPETQERLQLLFDNPHQPRLIGSDPVRQNPELALPSSFFPNNPSPYTKSYSTARKSSNSSASTRSSLTSNNSGCNSDADSSSSWSTAPPANPVERIPWDLNRQIIMGEYQSGYDLPCEFSFLDCNVRHPPELHLQWIAHGASHFTDHDLPPRLVCTFCDAEFDSSRSNGDRMANYKRRMIHIGEHFWRGRSLDVTLLPANHPRPDFHVLDYLWQNSLIDERDYRYLVQHTERPYCENIRPLGFVPNEVQAKRAREDRRPHDQAREDRQRRKERGGKGKSTHHQKVNR